MVAYRFAQKNIQLAVFDLPNLHAFIVPQYALSLIHIFGRLTRYLVVPLVFCVILFPLYGLMHQQTEKAQLTDAAEQLATAVSTFEGYLSDLRFTTNKLFNDDSYKLLAVSDDDSLMGDYMTSFNASTLLQDLTYSMSYTAYSLSLIHI